MTELPSIICNLPSAKSQNGKESVFRSGGQTKQFPPRPRITTAKPQSPPSSASATQASGDKRRGR